MCKEKWYHFSFQYIIIFYCILCKGCVKRMCEKKWININSVYRQRVCALPIEYVSFSLLV